MNKFLPIALALVLAAGCANQKGTIQASSDRFTGITLYNTRAPFLPESSLTDNCMAVLNLAEKVRPDGKASFYLVLNSIAGHLDPNEFKTSLYVLADGRRFSYSWDDNQGNRYWFPVPKDQAQAIAGASAVQIRVVLPDNTYWESQLQPATINLYHQFAARYIQ